MSPISAVLPPQLIRPIDPPAWPRPKVVSWAKFTPTAGRNCHSARAVPAKLSHSSASDAAVRKSLLISGRVEAEEHARKWRRHDVAAVQSEPFHQPGAIRCENHRHAACRQGNE